MSKYQEQFPVGSIWRDTETGEVCEVLGVKENGKRVLVSLESHKGRSTVSLEWMLRQFERL